jgi:hypothetical protein
MSTYQYAAPAPARRGGVDVAAWALVALIVAAVCAFAGWALARGDSPSRDEVYRDAALASQEGLQRGQSLGISQGARQGRREASARANAQVSAARQQASREGYDAGYADGRSKAGDPDAYVNSTAGLGASGAYPAADYSDVLAAGLFGGDAPGYSTSAFDAYGYGVGSTTPYIGSTTPLTTSLGDDLGY